MEELQKAFFKTLNDLKVANPEQTGQIDIKELVANVTPEAVALIKGTLQESTKKMLEEHRALARGFEARNIKRWSKAFDLLETHIVICTEAGEEFNSSYRATAVEDNDLVFDIVVRHHARACHIAQEILHLLKSGFADAAHARWSEPPRLYRRLHILRGWSYELTKTIFPRSPRASCSISP